MTMMLTETDIRDRIAGAAARLFRRFGVRGIRMDDIAVELGMSKRTIYEHVRDKETLVGLALGRMTAESREETQRVFQQASNVIEGLIRIMDLTRDRVRETNPTLIKDIRSLYPRIWQDMLRYRDEVQLGDAIAMIESGVEQGLFRADIDPDVIAKLLFAQFEVLQDEERFPPDRYDPVDLLHTILLNFIRGIATDQGRSVVDDLVAQNSI